MPAEINIAVSSEALIGKSRAYIGKALLRKGAEDLEEYQLWASLALELLGKASLADRHPCLVVDPTHSPSLLVAAGVPVTSDVKTITAKTLYERLQHTIDRFDETAGKFCLAISQRRNSELHSGDLPFRAMKIDAWEAQFWSACDIILDAMNITLTEWLGADEAAVPQMIVQEAAAATRAAAILKVEGHKRRFDALPKSTREERLAAAQPMRSFHYGAQLFRTGLHDETWDQVCPSCGGHGFLTGTLVSESVSEDQHFHDFWETVERIYSAEEFKCPVCDLNLIGQTEIQAAGLDLYFEDMEEREISYEPEYGND